MAQDTLSARDEAVALLALDGGGIRGVSELLILDEIMRRIQFDQKLLELPRPCDYFHLIGGTSTGGLIALMLGRLKMSTKEALETYQSLARTVFSKKNKKPFGKDGSFKATTLQNAVQMIVSKKCSGEDMIDPSNPSPKGMAFVCALPANNTAHIRRFRTYRVRDNASVNCRVWEAARATTAAPTIFKRIEIGEEGQAKEEFIDAGLGCNNPADEVLKEARNTFGTARLVRCLVSIGTGHPGTIGLAKPDTFQKILPTALISTLKKIVTDCEDTANSLSERFKDLEKFYFRFNVTHGAGDISLEEWEKMGKLTEHTKAYMADVSVSKGINDVVNLLCTPQNTVWTLGTICGVPQIKNIFPSVQSRPKPAPSPIFTGREMILEKLEEFFLANLSSSVPRRECLLHGMGGVGKTQIALQFAQQVRDKFEPIRWIDATNRLTVEQSYRKIAAEYLGKVDNIDLVEAALQWLAHASRKWLLLFDNCGSVKDIDNLLPDGDHGNILYTSRDRTLSGVVQKQFEVPEMEDDDAVTLLLKATKQDETDERLRELAKPVVNILGNLPLAIDIAGASIYMRQNHLESYVHTFDTHRDEMMKDPTFKGSSKYNQAVYTTWDLSYEALRGFAKGTDGSARSEDAKAALQILHLFAFLYQEDIMEETFQRAAQTQLLADDPRAQYTLDNGIKLSELLKLNPNRSWDRFLFGKGLSMLLSLSLIKDDQSGRYFSMHTLVHSWARDHIPIFARQHLIHAATALLSSSITWRFLSEDYAYRRQLLPHIKACELHDTSKDRTALANINTGVKFALVFNESGHWKEAEELEVQVMETRKRVLGTEHPDTLASMANLAATYWNQGRWKEAEELEVQVMETRKRVLGTEHPDTLTSMANLAATYQNQGRWKEAEELNMQVMETRKRVLGTEHPSTLTSMANLAATYRNQGRWKEAEELEVQVMETSKRVLGTEHPDTLTSMANLAATYRNQGRWKEAEELEVQVMETSKRVLGTEHPSTLTSMANLAATYQNQGRWKEAEELEVQVMETRKRVLGTEHPDTLTSMANLAATYQNQGRWKEAEELNMQVMETRKRVLGTEHPSTLTSMANLAATYQNQGRWKEAEELEVQVMETRKRVLGTEHPDTLSSMSNLAFTWQGQDKRVKALRLMEECVLLRSQILGVNHHLTRSSSATLTGWRMKELNISNLASENEEK